MKQYQDLQSMSLADIEQVMLQLGEKSYRAKQIFQWLHKHCIDHIDKMNNIPKHTRKQLIEIAPWCKIQLLKKYKSQKDDTIKYLFTLSDHNIIECVFMKYRHGNTVCISSQVGCRMGCHFCASTLEGLVRHLTPGEMLSQVYEIQKDVGERISNIVIMGSGEPLDNMMSATTFIDTITSPIGLNISQRNITLSTCGLVQQIYQLAKLQYQITLAISLHAPNDDIRKQIMPIAYKYSFEELIKACTYYIQHTKRRITFEYALIEGLNDQVRHAKELSQKLKELLCHVNLIPINEIEERSYESTSLSHAKQFQSILQRNGIPTTIRRKLGEDIEAACGQLRRGYLSQQE
ncbi:MAG: 23S rRNA (adenine(2503)-C(2))-methyltransferase RlmN [Epulopiscium sp.]|nr:23S rRNA (adenine(2503)-C(2))-methyltransferase RlmN [Candidatus Epulonipiscium sp.]